MCEQVVGDDVSSREGVKGVRVGRGYREEVSHLVMGVATAHLVMPHEFSKFDDFLLVDLFVFWWSHYIVDSTLRSARIFGGLPSTKQHAGPSFLSSSSPTNKVTLTGFIKIQKKKGDFRMAVVIYGGR